MPESLTYQNYIQGMLVSLSREQRDWRKDIPEKLYLVQHALIGITTEIGELIEALNSHKDPRQLDWVNVREEIGDLWWYVALLAYALNKMEPDHCLTSAPVERVSMLVINNLVQNLTLMNARSMDVVKRRIYYFADDESPKASWDLIPVGNIVQTMAQLTKRCGFRLGETWFINLDKLIGPDGRYSEKFDPKQALYRNLEAERKVLEGGA